MKYKVRAIEMNYLPEVTIDAASEDEAETTYKQRWDAGELPVEDYDMNIIVEPAEDAA